MKFIKTINKTILYIALVFITDQVIANQNPPNNWHMRTNQHHAHEGGLSNSASNEEVNSRWVHDTMNKAFIGPNAWGFGGNTGGTGPDSDLRDAYVEWKYLNGENKLQLEWFVGGYHRDFNGRPGAGWYYRDQNGVQQKGGNNVKAYPRMGIGSASGQPFATSGSPNTPSYYHNTARLTTVDLEEVRSQVGLPERIRYMPDIYVHIDLEFSGGSNAVSERDKYGNYFFAIDSYYHDIDDKNLTTRPDLEGLLEGINDSSGDIYGTQMSGLPDTTKRWATMVWYHKSPYFHSSGGTPLNNDQPVVIDGREYLLRYKIETASDKKFKYISFIMNRPTSELTKGGKQPVLNYKNFALFLSDGRLQNLLDKYHNEHPNSPLKDVDGRTKRIIAPSQNLVLSDINVGVEVSANPDTAGDISKRPVKIKFNQLYFDVRNKGKFGFVGNPEEQSTILGLVSQFFSSNSQDVCKDTPPYNDDWGWNDHQNKSCHLNAPVAAAANEATSSNCRDTPPYNDNWGWNDSTNKSCKLK